MSVIVPVYNSEAYLAMALQSICAQTYQNLEILLIDDGSLDKSLEICKAWAEKDSRIKVVHQENAGASAARNKGIELAEGTYLLFMDADDWIEKNMIEVLYNEAEKHKADAACCILKEETDKNACRKRTDVIDLEEKVKAGFHKAESGLLLLRVWGPVCKLYRREVIGDIRFEDYKVAEDLLFNTKVICAESFQRAVLVEYPFYHYMIYPGSAMKQKFQEKYLTAMEVEKECYNMLTEISPEFADINLIGCSVSRVFEKYAKLSPDERRKYKADFKRCKQFAWKHRKELLGSTDRHRRISGALKVYIPDIYLWLLTKRYRKRDKKNEF